MALCPVQRCSRIRAPLPQRHCERSEAIQTVSAAGFLDCFAVLAMTDIGGYY
jgi:hypothetical protein